MVNKKTSSGKNKSAGILLYRFRNNLPEIFLVHPGGPFWIKKDLGAWSIPKGEFGADEDPLSAAKRELEEETGIKVSGEFIELTPVKQKAANWYMHGLWKKILIRHSLRVIALK